MTLRKLTDAERTFLRNEPTPEGQPNKIRRALRLVNANLERLSEATGINPTQLGRYVSGADLRMSTAGRIAAVLGVDISDLWPIPPFAKGERRRKSKSTATGKRAAKSPRAKGPKASLAEVA